jgi:curved DNA-binding protein CbpA
MNDYFALLGQARRPWVEAEALKAGFFELSAGVHPDRVHEAAESEKQRANQRYAELNAAYNCLRAPKSRLQHLLELELGAKPKEVQPTAAGAIELCMAVGQFCGEVDRFLAERAEVTSPVLKVQQFERAQEWIERLTAVRCELNEKQEGLAGELKEMNAPWDTAPTSGEARRRALPLRRLEEIWRDWSYLARWGEQIQERIVQLSF